ncbi:MAG: cellulase family glycosylhydrolase [FCB group bacterium]|nr:cellulase family glycosylhydrolase [FCB group bacterium]MBL7027932.1 cellulase family glycosylhydrolase [Candidatus Neomarinimicrobiota bacterium]MBL7121941.1 cellulase family glycosylhydrolase [Candidatus Neomarinimicrobiota bacterium]
MKIIKWFLTTCMLLILGSEAQAYYTTDGQNVVDKETGEIIQLRGIGLGGWLLPEGYMWGIRKLNRPRHFEVAIEELIGSSNAAKFWDLYYTNFITRKDVEIMKSFGVNTLRVPLLASMIQPRDQQPDRAPFVYDEHNFQFLDDFVEWCEIVGMGVIWDLHGAPGGQNAENISDSDGEARLWTEKSIYWPQTIDLWDTITRRYADKSCIVGYDLLNEPLLARYDEVDPGLLRELYVLITQVIRETDQDGIIFIEGDDWAQDFSVLEPMDWDPHLVMAFHSYPPTNTQRGLQRWEDLRIKYDIPLWHGETGEQDPPWELYTRSTEFLEGANVGWNWWTHKKFELNRQPWSIRKTAGFKKILAYWNGEGPKPSKWQATRWLFKQARMTNSQMCDFLPGMVQSLHPLDPQQYAKTIELTKPIILESSPDRNFMEGYPGVLRVKASGYPLQYQWYRNGDVLPSATGFELYLHELPMDLRSGKFHAEVWNNKGRAQTNSCKIEWQDFDGYQIHYTSTRPEIDGLRDDLWREVQQLSLNNSISGSVDGNADLSAWFSTLWDWGNLYFYMEIQDDSLSTNSSVGHLNDGIEIYLDTDNSKSKFFGEDEFQLRFVLNGESIYADIGAYFEGATVEQVMRRGGYAIEIAIPWESLNGYANADHFLGLDVHINDNDSNTRNGKMSWFTPRDNAYQSPANFGTVRLVESVSNPE